MNESISSRISNLHSDIVRRQEARVDFDPSEQLNELLASFLNEEAYVRLGARTLRLTLNQPPVRYETGDNQTIASITEYDRALKNATPRQLRVRKIFEYQTDGTSKLPAKNLYIRMRLGGSTLASAIAQEPFYRERAPLFTVTRLPREDLLPSRELEEIRQSVAAELQSCEGGDDFYTSPDYVVRNPRVVIRTLPPLTV